jgi:methyl-accepting chemotaxis protein
LIGNSDIEDSLKRLDKLTQEEARMASAEQLKMTHGVDDRVKDVEGKVQGVRSDVHDVGNKVQGVEGKVQHVDDKVQGIASEVRGVDDRLQDVGRDVRSDVQDVGDKVQGIASEVRGVDNKLDQANRSLSLYLLLIVPSAQTALQGISSKTVFSDGFPPRIHQSIITSHPKLITVVQLNGFFKAVYSINGDQLTPSYGYTENVRYSLS